MSYLPADDQIRQQMEELMKVVDLETMSTKQFIAALSNKFGGIDLSSKKKFIKAAITEIIDEMEKAGSGGDDDDASDDDTESSEDEEEEVKVPKKRPGGGGGLSAVKEISDELAEFLQNGKHMARTAIVKALWDYIKENNLQNPSDKREILLDAKMKAVFGVDSFTMFSMNKYIGAHVEPYKPVDLTTSAASKKRKAKDDQAAGEGKNGSGGSPAKKKSGTQAPYRLSDDMVAVVAKRVLPRPQVTQALWAYIRENNLQNPQDKREILCDTLLSRVMGGEKKVTMFAMQKYISPHLLEKLDKSAYDHDNAGKEGESGSDDGSVEGSDDE
mmetsp:Transcript_39720/g.95546  ORF Transcript_39720/g.95546 Transcript_39720/m.95546 type:complete len:329 (+) Transcript_39720:158-1144(+)